MENHLGDTVELLGTRDGYGYYESPDGYVYQMLPNGKWNGWFCSMVSWERELHNILN